MPSLKQKLQTKFFKEKFNQFDGRFLYLVKCNEYYKIGVAHDLDNRLNSLQCGNPYRLELVSAVKLMDSDYCEELLHQRYDSRRGIGEWFKLTDGDVKELLILMNKHGNL